MKSDKHGETDPRYMQDLEPEKETCGACEEEEATDYWLTTLGRMYLCGYCLDFHLKEDTHFLIERL